MDPITLVPSVFEKWPSLVYGACFGSRIAQVRILPSRLEGNHPFNPMRWSKQTGPHILVCISAGSQVVRQETANLLFVGSNPTLLSSGAWPNWIRVQGCEPWEVGSNPTHLTLGVSSRGLGQWPFKP